jgi:hypothetical protein
MHFIRKAEYSRTNCRFDFQLIAGVPDNKALNIIYSHCFGEDESTALFFGQDSRRTECPWGDDIYPDTMIEMDPLDFQALISAASGEERLSMLKDIFWMNGSAEDAAAAAFLSRYAEYLSERITGDRMDAHMLYAFTDLCLDPEDILMNVFCQETWQEVHTAAVHSRTEAQLFDRLRALDGLRMYDDDSIHEIARFCTECDYTPDERVEVHFTTQEDKLKMRILWR